MAGRRRILLYSHDTYGLGHLRRCLLIARRLSALPGPPSVLLVTGSPRAQSFDLPPGCDTLKLPSATKTPQGTYRARSLETPLSRLVALRSELIRAAACTFEPDLVMIDHAPLGMAGELRSLLGEVSRQRPRPRVVLGLRDIIDDADRVAASWDADQVWDALAGAYDRILVYGDATILTTADELKLPTRLPGKVRFTGYLSGTARPPARPNGEPVVLVTAGGGGDGHHPLRAYADWLGSLPGPARFRSVVVTGPLLSSRRRREVEARFQAVPQPVEVVEFTDHMEDLMAQASAVIAMGGYNTVVEILASGVPALLFPRATPRREQLIRAERLAAVTALDYCAPDDDPVAAIDTFVGGLLSAPPAAFPSVDLHGLDQVAAEAADLLGLPHPCPHPEEESRDAQVG